MGRTPQPEVRAWLKKHAFRIPFCTHQFDLAEPGGTLVWTANEQVCSSRLLLQRGGSEKSHPRLSRLVERKSQALCLDRYRGIDHGKAVSLPTDAGKNPTRLYLATEQKAGAKEGLIVVQLFRGHYTSNGALLAAVYLWSDTDPAAIKIRLISARRATQAESAQYQEGL